MFEFVDWLRQHIDEFAGDSELAQEQTSASVETTASAAQDTKTLQVFTGQPLTDRKSKFLPHFARVTSLAEVKQVIRQLHSDKRISTATHPAIRAYRIAPRHGIPVSTCTTSCALAD